MRSIAESRNRWDETLRQSPSFAELQRSVKFNGPNSPCVKGSRSVCWKTFLLFQDAPAANWSHILLEARNTYSSLKDHYLKYIKNPEQLAQLSLDPLSDDPESPWDALRKDEVIRAEILQDVRRLPDEPFYHQESTQNLILDILFVYCKRNPEVGGYRQGMHELLAPLVYVISQDAIDRATINAADPADPVMVEMLDSYFVEHDSFTLFSRVMSRAKDYYEISSDPHGLGSMAASTERSAIVELSKEIHEVTLMSIDPELATHLQNIEILPQIFLIRWMRLLFGREFHFEQLLILWDTIFAFDPNLQLIPLICVAMLMRVRWTLLEADYSTALQLLLKYPAPLAPHGPHTFVDDAMYLRDHLDTAGGVNLVLKYTGRAPAPPESTRPSTPPLGRAGLRERALGVRSPIRSPVRFMQNREGVEALFQGAAKGVIERGEKLGINQAVRDAMGEIRRNMQGFQEARSLAKGRDLFGEAVPSSSSTTAVAQIVSEMERRNKALAAMLGESLTTLTALSSPPPETAQDSAAAAAAAAAAARKLKLASAQIQAVKAYLEDSSLAITGHANEASSPTNALSFTSSKKGAVPTIAVDTTVVTTNMFTATPSVDDGSPSQSASTGPLSAATAIVVDAQPSKVSQHGDDPMDTDPPKESHLAGHSLSTTNIDSISIQETKETTLSTSPVLKRPELPIPTRSTLAQSSFAWMLDPDISPSSSASQHRRSTASKSSPSPFSPSSSSSFSSSKNNHDYHHQQQQQQQQRSKRPSSHASSRDRNAFLFGEVTSDSDGERPPTSDEIFGLEPLRKALPKSEQGSSSAT